uniref:Immunoglobulin domain-containing protein n=1 Tax=Scleropages formosus TaxID=113540 RepID=A0A8C9V4T7_SCLFO
MIVKCVLSCSTCAGSLICECAADVEKRAVKLGDNVTLHCSCIHSEETLWFGQQSDQTNGSFAVKNFFQSYIAEFNKENNSISLNILNIRASDLGLFYCLTTNFTVKIMCIGNLSVFQLRTKKKHKTYKFVEVRHAIRYYGELYALYNFISKQMYYLLLYK